MVLRAVLIAISLLVTAIIYSDIIEEEMNYDDQESEATIPRTKNVAHNQEYFFDRLLDGESGSFESPNYPTADHNLDFIWLIQVGQDKIIRLDFLDFDTESNYDFIFVHDGATTNDPILLTLSGSYSFPAIRSSANYMLIRFVTDNKITSRGFHANYFAVPPCSKVLHTSSGTFMSHNYPLEYDKNMRCDWLITVGESEKILLEFVDVNTEKDYDIIQIYDGGSDRAPMLDRISGNHKDEILIRTTTSNVVFIRFTTDKSISGTGFSAKYTAGSAADLFRYMYAEYSEHLTNSGDPVQKSEGERDDENSNENDSGIEDKDISAYLLNAFLESIESNSTT